MLSFPLVFPFYVFFKLKNHKNTKHMEKPKNMLIPSLKYKKPRKIFASRKTGFEQQAALRGCQASTTSDRSHPSSAISCMWLQSEIKSRTEHLAELNNSQR